MRSRITIEIDFDKNNQPVIQIIQQDSDDVRDRLISNFLQSLAHTSRWCTISYSGYGVTDDVKIWKVSPIKPEDISHEVDLMNAVLMAGKIPNPIKSVQ